MLALPEHTFSPNPRLPFNNNELVWLQQRDPKFELPARGSWEEIHHRRQLGSTKQYPAKRMRDGAEVEEALPIPLVYGLTEYQQYREPHAFSGRQVASVAKRVLNTAPLSPNGSKPKTAKMYRVIRTIITPRELADGVAWDEPIKLMPYFLGEFDHEGNLTDV